MSNINEASGVNPGCSTFAFSIRDSYGNFIYAKLQRMEVETTVINEALAYCRTRKYMGVDLETDSLVLTKMILQQWRILWELTEKIEEIMKLLSQLQVNNMHTFREGNGVTNALANETMEPQASKEYHNYRELSRAIKGLINNKEEVPYVRVKTRKINNIHGQEQTGIINRCCE